jgi:hypothetical protein
MERKHFSHDIARGLGEARFFLMHLPVVFMMTLAFDLSNIFYQKHHNVQVGKSCKKYDFGTKLIPYL